MIYNTPAVKSFPIKVNNFGNKYCVVYFHGLLGSSSHKHVLQFIEDLNAHQIDNCSFDFWGHGERKENISEFDTYKYVEETKMVIHTLKNLGYKKFIFVGESLGGFLVQTLKSTKVDCIGIIYLFSVFNFDSPSNISYSQILECYNKNIPLKISSLTGAKQIILSKTLLEGIIKYQNEREKVVDFQRNIPKLIINGKYDSTCHYQTAIEFANHFDDAKLVLVNTEHNGYDRNTCKYSSENTSKINKEMIKFIKAVTAVYNYLK